MEKLCIGMQVDIVRSDGRVHGALITHLRPEAKVVSVEWFEQGETKGKEVDIAVLIKNNPSIFNIPQPSKATSTTPRQRQGQVQQQNDPVQSTDLNETIRSTNGLDVENRRRGLSLSSSAEQTTTKLQPKISRKTENFAQKNRPLMKYAPDIEAIDENPRFLVTQPQKERESLALAPNQSKLLTNIGELERNRDKRRNQQLQAKKHREQQMSIDPGNPNWEFLTMIREYQEQLDYRPLKLNDHILDNRICVCVRKRPMNNHEITRKEIEVITVPNKDHVIVHQPQVKVDLTKYLVNQKFRFDYTFNEDTSNELAYKFTAQPLVRTIFQSGFATCFAYGQTGSGKTHTMGGVFEGKKQNWSNGIYALTAADVFKMLKEPEYRRMNLYVTCSFFEIYGAKVFDLLGRRAKLRVLEDGRKAVQVVGLKEIRANCVEDVLKLIRQGSEQRTAGQTSANSNSSRSHAVFQINLRKIEGKNETLYGKFSLIDLAGNERGADTISSDRQTRLEGAEINKSLLALKECIRAMGRDEQHVPFRGSKLTLILRDSFIGRNAKTCMIAMISPSMSCVENTMNTLRYADRVKELGSDEISTPMEDEELMVASENIKIVAEIDNASNQATKRSRAKEQAYEEVVDALGQAEDKAIDEQSNFMDTLQKSTKILVSLMKKVGQVDYDVEEYTINSINALRDIADKANQCKAFFENLAEKIRMEQELTTL